MSRQLPGGRTMADNTEKSINASTVCKEFDITKNTLFKWEREGKISKVKKDWRGWRVFSEENIDEIRGIIEAKARKNREK